MRSALPILVAAASAICFGLSAFGQVESAPPPAEPQATTATSVETAFEPLQKSFSNVALMFRERGKILPEDMNYVRSLRERVSAFNAENPGFRRGLVVELQLAQWLKEDDRIAPLFEKLHELSSNKDQVIQAWSKYLTAERRWSEAADAFAKAQIDPAKSPKLAADYSAALFAAGRFQESLDVLNSIPGDILKREQLLAASISTVRGARESYPALWEAEKALRESEAVADDLPHVELNTTRGTFVVELFENNAPNTVANFINLAEKGLYDACRFHRVEDSLIQGGDPNTKPNASGVPGTGGPGYRIPDEHLREGARNHFAGSLAMAHTGIPDSAGSQFYITVLPMAEFNGKYTVFGRVISGMDVVMKIQRNDVIESARVMRKRERDYRPQTIPLDIQPISPGADGAGAPIQLFPDSIEPPPTPQPVTPPTADEPSNDE